MDNVELQHIRAANSDGEDRISVACIKQIVNVLVAIALEVLTYLNGNGKNYKIFIKNNGTFKRLIISIGKNVNISLIFISAYRKVKLEMSVGIVIIVTVLRRSGNKELI